MMQKQHVSSSGTAYQAGGDITVNQGTNVPEIVAEIVSAVAVKMTEMHFKAKEEYDRRIKEISDNLLQKIDDLKIASNARWEEPSVQISLSDAIKGFGASGSEELKQELLNLVVDMVAQDGSSRTAMIISRAINIVPNLTSEERAVLVVLFLTTGVHLGQISFNEAVSRTAGYLEQFIESLPDDSESLHYLQSISCVTISSMPQTWSIFDSFDRAYPELNVINLSLNINSDYSVRKTEPDISRDRHEVFYSNIVMSRLSDVWKNKSYPSSALTPIGKAIAFSILKSRNETHFPDIETFVR